MSPPGRRTYNPRKIRHEHIHNPHRLKRKEVERTATSGFGGIFWQALMIGLVGIASCVGFEREQEKVRERSRQDRERTEREERRRAREERYKWEERGSRSAYGGSDAGYSVEEFDDEASENRYAGVDRYPARDRRRRAERNVGYRERGSDYGRGSRRQFGSESGRFSDEEDSDFENDYDLRERRRKLER
jgi:hypothetical protein